MASISSAGIGSGLNVEDLVSKLVAAERTPITQLSTRTDGLKTELSVFGKVQSALATLRDAASKLNNPSSWAGTLATSNNPTAVSVSAGSGAAIGSVAVSVSKLAQSQTLVSGTPYAGSTTTVGQGSLTITLGKWATDGADPPTYTGFTDKAGATPITINIGAGQDTLAGIRDAINASGAGVTASIVNDSTGARLTLRSTETGETNAFRIEGTGGLTSLSYDPRVGVTSLIQTLPAQNARALINGIDVSSESNTLKQAIDGLNITLLNTTTVPASIAVTQDKDSIKKLITDFTAAYNAVNSLLREQTKYDAGSKTAGALQGDSTAIGLQAQLRSIIGGTTTFAGSIGRLAQIGLEPGTDGNLTTSDTKLTTALSDLDSLKKLFMGLDSTDSANSGFAQRIRSYVDGALSTEGRVSSKQAGLQKQIDSNNKRMDQMEDRVALTEKRLRARYTALDTQMAQLNGLSNYITQQLANLNLNK
ncbi:flagellar filament capping protein FliD [Roseateles asaccharophilus]|uniref:Flagellar hook-associated protein 2 n=1 Tax=Roseateles asaccharophilus TaxID=582607 RepID=A0ABU2ACR3_9BURK|nr:flagellar filament capping protein FliD [Roseateles asaccharophilus]MDR7334980.1 flagellar hook-associated protein 2 [Roseateles asaccharophilus]